MNHQGNDESIPIPEVNLGAYMTSLLRNINLTFETWGPNHKNWRNVGT